MPTRDIITRAISSAKEWAIGNECKSKIKESMVTSISSAEIQEVTCHTYAAWREDLKLAGLGWMLCSQLTGTLRSFSTCATFVSSPLVAKGLAIRATLHQAVQEGLRSLSVKSDSFQLVRAINFGSKITKLHGILHDISLLSLRFESICFSFIPRIKNTIADSLAKDALFDHDCLYQV
ncbi:unnamed protein product [Arabis nemorensis]|uniref:RNase H type-1 domain-containing protein n=1 Tax=Arabis nemorensis TaxID=586526 RepID=A0A565CVR3_9BRAS|nr:unnamed protein product [Arabis nemorensis]